MDEVLPISTFDTLAREYGWVVAALALFAFIVFSFKRHRRTEGFSSQRREQAFFAQPSAAVPQEMERLLGDLQELSQHINTTIDAKFSKLEQSIAEADKRIATLRMLLQNAKDGSLKTPAVRNGPPSWPVAPVLSTRPTPALNILIGDDGVEEGSIHSDTPQRSPQVDSDPHRQIYELFDRGRSVLEIAREMRKSPGEVELILKLRRR